MKRDMDIVREILLYFEELETFDHQHAAAIEIPDRDARGIQYHVDLMYEAGS